MGTQGYQRDNKMVSKKSFIAELNASPKITGGRRVRKTRENTGDQPKVVHGKVEKMVEEASRKATKYQGFRPGRI